MAFNCLFLWSRIDSSLDLMGLNLTYSTIYPKVRIVREKIQPVGEYFAFQFSYNFDWDLCDSYLSEILQNNEIKLLGCLWHAEHECLAHE